MKAVRMENYKRLLEKHGKGTRLLDIATGHGKFAIMAALMGYIVTAFDARPDRMPDYLPGIDWRVANLKDWDFGAYDTINCLGIFYHLPLEEQFKLLKQINYTTVILDTHFVTEAAQTKWKPSEKGKYTGLICKEGDDLESMQKDKLLNAFDDLSNFCHTEPSLYQIFKDFGMEVIDEAPGVTADRKYYVLVPAGE